MTPVGNPVGDRRLLANRMTCWFWTADPSVADDKGRRIISMRKANGKEQARYLQRLGEG